jgi:hypothetical protein
MARTIEEDIAQLEKDIRQMKIEYEQYFGGGKVRPPTEIEWRVDSMLKRYSDRGANMSYSQRFQYGNLVQMYTKYRDMFRKRLKQKEEGTLPRHFGAAAREIAAQRALRQAGPESSNTAELPFSVSWNDPDLEQQKVEQLYSAFCDAKARAGEDAGPLTMAAFRNFVRQKTEQLKKQEDANEVEYIVSVEGNHARLKARVKTR